MIISESESVVIYSREIWHNEVLRGVNAIVFLECVAPLELLTFISELFVGTFCESITAIFNVYQPSLNVSSVELIVNGN